ncbi:MAG: PQQ-binding-like beta-propeller repeat protein [Acidobacteriota bacterium]
MRPAHEAPARSRGQGALALAAAAAFLFSCPAAPAQAESLEAAKPASGAGDSWTTFRGGPDAPRGVLPEAFGLAVEWKRELGSGYSGISLKDGVLVTLFTAGADDVLGAFDAATGEEKWRVRLAEKYEAHDGSDDGPLSVPSLDGDQVFALGPRGQLVAVALGSGEEQWRVQLDASNSTVPYFGYTTSPLVVDELVVVLAGGEGRAVQAFDRRSGELRWKAGSDSVTYQTPILAELAGRRQVIAVTDQWVWGLEPKTGEALWSHRIQTGETTEESAHPTILGEDLLLIDITSESMALRVTPAAGDGFEVAEVWRSRAFGNTLVLPGVVGSHAYGFTGRILTAIDSTTGETVWRTRDLKGPNLSLTDGHLAVLTDDGELVVAKADPEGYQERARIQVLESGDYANPSFASGRFYVRNQTHLAAVKVIEGAAAVPTEAPESSGPAEAPEAHESAEGASEPSEGPRAEPR